MSARSPRSISTSPLKNCAGISASVRPSASTKVWVPIEVCRARTSSVIPIRSSSSIWAPRKSTPWPPARNADACSTTVTSWPRRASQYASVGPAMLAPEIRTFMGSPSSSR
jgi:hypothetical protein